MRFPGIPADCKRSYDCQCAYHRFTRDLFALAESESQ